MNKIKKTGFTLFELLVSISIIAILVALATTSYSAAQKKARDAKRMQDLELVRKAAEQFYMLNNSSYPDNNQANQRCVPNAKWSVNNQTVLESLPADPKNVDPYLYNCSFPSTPGEGYCFCAVLEGRTGNSSNNGCTFTNVGGTGPYYCVKNQQ